MQQAVHKDVSTSVHKDKLSAVHNGDGTIFTPGCSKLYIRTCQHLDTRTSNKLYIRTWQQLYTRTNNQLYISTVDGTIFTQTTSCTQGHGNSFANGQAKQPAVPRDIYKDKKTALNQKMKIFCSRAWLKLHMRTWQKLRKEHGTSIIWRHVLCTNVGVIRYIPTQALIKY